MNPVEEREQSANDSPALRWDGAAPTGVRYCDTLTNADYHRRAVSDLIQRLGGAFVITDLDGKPIPYRDCLNTPFARDQPRGVEKYQYHRLVARYVPDHGWMLVCMHCDSDDNSSVISMTPILLTEKVKHICP